MLLTSSLEVLERISDLWVAVALYMFTRSLLGTELQGSTGGTAENLVGTATVLVMIVYIHVLRLRKSIIIIWPLIWIPSKSPHLNLTYKQQEHEFV